MDYTGLAGPNGEYRDEKAVSELLTGSLEFLAELEKLEKEMKNKIDGRVI